MERSGTEARGRERPFPEVPVVVTSVLSTPEERMERCGVCHSLGLLAPACSPTSDQRGVSLATAGPVPA